MIESEAKLLALIVQHDDRDAFAALVRRYQSPVRNFLRKLTNGDVERSNDLAQETFIKLYRALASYRGEARFSTWLYQIAYHAFLNDKRGQKDQEELDESLHSKDRDPADIASDEADVARALRLLNQEQRAIFDLHYQKGMSHQEVATTMNIPLGTVKSELLRGLEKLREQLSQKEIA